MVIRLPKKARTSPEIRREIQASELPATESPYYPHLLPL